jgi:hypothetical protein
MQKVWVILLIVQVAIDHTELERVRFLPERVRCQRSHGCS